MGMSDKLWWYLGPQQIMTGGDMANVTWTTTEPAFSTFPGISSPYEPLIITDGDTVVGFAPNPASPAPEAAHWEGILAVEGLVSSDGRYLMPGKIDWRELPLTLMAQTVNEEGHTGSFVAGKITDIRREDRPDLGDGAVAIIGTGVFDDGEGGTEAARLLEAEMLRHVSIDFSPTEAHMLDPETLNVIAEEDVDLSTLLGGDFVRGYEGRIMGATLLPFSAFEEATMHIVDVPGQEMLVASAFTMRKVLTASAAGIAPLLPPHDWFYEPETPGPCPLTVTEDGKVFGHLALWNQCHRQVSGSCEMAPRSRSGYAYFHTGALTTDDGRKVNVGRITVGGGHASTSPYLGMKGAIDHYDETGMVGAFVRATDGDYGIWLSGAVRSDCPSERVRDLEANPPSGDWREENGRLELCAALSVPVAGFPVPRYEAALVASAGEERVVALIATGYVEEHALSRADQRRFSHLLDVAKRELAFVGARDFELESEEFADITAAQRRKWAKSGVALPDGSFPIPDCSYAEKAIRAQGRAPDAKRGRVRAHIRKRVSSLGCSGGIFDGYK